MGAPQSGKTKKKFNDEDIAEVFTGPYREEQGKIPLTVKEITEILNKEILVDKSVTRQAVDKRLDALVGTEFEELGGKLYRRKHGRSHLYYRDTDLERVFADGGTVTVASVKSQNRHLIMLLLVVGLGLIGSGILVPASSGLMFVAGALSVVFAVIGYLLFKKEIRDGSNRLWKLGEKTAEKLQN